MTNILRLISLGAVLINAGAAPAAERADHPASREHRATLDSYRTTLVRGYLDGNPAGIVRHLSETVQLLPAYQKTVLGKADAATYHQAFLKRFAVSAYQRQPLEVADLGQRVMEIGRFTMTSQRADRARRTPSRASTWTSGTRPRRARSNWTPPPGITMTPESL